ncbi:MAG: Coenzyme F420 hydrogenase/dehydrogenase, beta subunit C-terminal domain [Sedimentisphaerales bacterium]|nr:Coenzyme F420 hydrogenase/dehydrogenase, beta subunit C-terminal domain [Sedimentisphaerales bacterium]
MAESVLDRIVVNKLCVGCGVCAGVFPEVLRMYTDKYGTYLPELFGESDEDWGKLSLKVCPFSNNQVNEDGFAAEMFGHQEGIEYRLETGYYLKCFAGHVTDMENRLMSTSGGIITWLAGEMLSMGMVDAVACVGQSDKRGSLFEYQLITEIANLCRCTKAKYYPVEVSEIIGKIKKLDKRVLFIGLPCFLKALKLAGEVDSVLKSRITYTIGLFCGHLKTKQYSSYLSRCCGVNDEKIKTVDFRKKVADKPANQYAFEVIAKNDANEYHRQIMMRDVWASGWGYNLFMLDACECCDDVMSETAHISVGDAWLGEYVKDYRGTSIIVCRHKEMLDLLETGVGKGALSLKEIPVEKVIKSQVGCIRQRREGLQYRLYISAKNGQWRPHKRVTAKRKVGTLCYRMLQLLRMKSKAVSKEAFLEQQLTDGIGVFVKKLWPWITMINIVNFMRHVPYGIAKGCCYIWNIFTHGGKKENNE